MFLTNVFVYVYVFVSVWVYVLGSEIPEDGSEIPEVQCQRFQRFNNKQVKDTLYYKNLECFHSRGAKMGVPFDGTNSRKNMLRRKIRRHIVRPPPPRHFFPNMPQLDTIYIVTSSTTDKIHPSFRRMSGNSWHSGSTTEKCLRANLLVLYARHVRDVFFRFGYIWHFF